MNSSETLWNSLEIIKILVSVLTPIIVLLVGLWINKRLKLIEHLQWANQKLIDKRLDIYEELVPRLNDLLCYFTYIGSWKDSTPIDVIEMKRGLDKAAHVYAPLYSPEFLERYQALMDLCFKTYTGWGESAKLRTKIARRKETSNSLWKPEWNQHFAENGCPDPSEIRNAYIALVSLMAEGVGIGLEPRSVTTGEVPGNIDGTLKALRRITTRWSRPS